MLIFWLFVTGIIVQCGYAFYFFVRIFRFPRGEQILQKERRGVSVIICAKNEADNLRKNLPIVLSQNYSDALGTSLYEVIVVNDTSTDDTGMVLRELEMMYDHLWDVPIPAEGKRNLPGKKFALSEGVEHARNEWLVLIDADCAPDGDTWLARMVAPLAKNKEIVLGYGGYYKHPGLLNAFVRWETIHAFLQYSTYATAGLPYMAVGRNLACAKKVLQRAQQHEKWNSLSSGDDDLLVCIAGTSENSAVVSEAEAFTHTEAKATVREWMKQKQRHLSTGKYYKGNIKVLLGAYGVSHAMVWIGYMLLLFSNYRDIASILMAIRCVVYWVLWGKTAGKLREKSLILLFPFFDLAWLIYNFAFLPYITWKNKEQWK